MATRAPYRLETFAGARCLIPAIHHAGLGICTRAVADAYRPERHDDAFELTYVERGAADWVVGDQLHAVRAGEALVIPPGAWHGGDGAVMHPCRFWWVICEPGDRGVAEALRAIAGRPFAVPPALGALGTALVAELRDAGAFAGVRVRALLDQVLVDAVRAARAAPPPPSARVARVLDWIDARLEDAPTIAEAARAARLSPTALHRLFVRELGCPPAEWLARRRIARAKQHLRQGRASITDLAHRLGFASSQYFATAFRRFTGMSPRAYRDA